MKEETPGEPDFIIGESHAIMRYLADTRGAADNWYPKDLKKRAMVDQYLDSHTGDLRAVIAGVIQRMHFGAHGGGSDENLKPLLERQQVVFAKLEKTLS